MTKNAKARNGATGVKAPEVKENNVDPALVKEIDKELGVLAGVGEQPHVEDESDRAFVEAAEALGAAPWLFRKSLAGFDRGSQEGRDGSRFGLSRHSASGWSASVFQASRGIQGLAGRQGPDFQELQNESGQCRSLSLG